MSDEQKTRPVEPQPVQVTTTKPAGQPVLGNIHEYHEVADGVKARVRTQDEKTADHSG